MATCNEPEIIEESYIPPFSILIKDTDGIENDSKTEIAVSKGELMIRIPESERAPGLGGDPSHNYFIYENPLVTIYDDGTLVQPLEGNKVGLLIAIQDHKARLTEYLIKGKTQLALDQHLGRTVPVKLSSGSVEDGVVMYIGPVPGKRGIMFGVKKTDGRNTVEYVSMEKILFEHEPKAIPNQFQTSGARPRSRSKSYSSDSKVGLQRDSRRSVINRAKIRLLNSFEKASNMLPHRSNLTMSRFSINDHVVVVTAQQVPVSGTIKWFGSVPTSVGDKQLVGIQTNRALNYKNDFPNLGYEIKVPLLSIFQAEPHGILLPEENLLLVNEIIQHEEASGQSRRKHTLQQPMKADNRADSLSSETSLKVENEHLKMQVREIRENLRLQIAQKKKLLSEMEELQQVVHETEKRLEDLEKKFKVKEEKLEWFEKSWKLKNEEVFVSEKVIGKGAWGNVREGKLRGTKVAVKQFHKLILSDKTLAIMEREIKTMSILRHPNLLLFIGAVLDHSNGHHLIITEVMDMSLRSAYEKRLVGDDNVKLAILRDTAAGLNYLHCHPDKIIHRDVSSANVLLQRRSSNEWTTKVADMGSANITRNAKSAGAGAPAYSSPESFTPITHTEDKAQTTKMDVYSYGVLFGELMTCRFPENKDVFRDILQKVSIPHLEMIQQCTKDEPSDRPTMAEIMDFLDKQLQ